MTIIVPATKTRLLTMDNAGCCHHIGYNGSARHTGTRWALYDLNGDLVRYTTSEQVAIDHCMGY